MVLALKIINGPLQDKTYKISAGLTIGRQKADLNLEDRKVSALHASVQENVGQLHLVDLDSRNGISLNGDRVNSIPMTPGVVFQIGTTSIQVVTLEDSDPVLSDPLETWRTILTKFNNTLALEVSFPESPVGPFTPALKLEVIQGRQLDTEWIVGYGPRKFGFHSSEFPIYEPNAPDICFELFPNEGPWFKTDFPAYVRLNGNSIACERVNPGDLIQIGDTVIRLDVIHDHE